MPGGWVELDHPLLRERLALHIAALLVVDLRNEYLGLLDRGEGNLQLTSYLQPSRDELAVELDGFLLVEGEAVALLHGDDLAELMLDPKRLRGRLLLLDAGVELGSDFNVLLAVSLHFRGPVVPVGGLTEVTLQHPEAVAPGLQGVRADQLAGVALAHLLQIVVSDVGPDQAGADQGVDDQAFRLEPREHLLQCRDVELDDVVTDDDIGVHQGM
ncbi:hypothetical protein LZK82_11150 [Rhizobium leguminosarum]|nr:hypothetical protein LZK82_11150 [Rhizobium leguminosarum]